MQPNPLPRSDTAIVILDGFTANPGDISWAAIEALGNCKIYDRTGEADVVARAADADIVLTNKTLITQKSLAALPRLRYIGVLATGYNTVDVQAAQQRGILVCNVPEYSTPNVTQAVFALLLELTNRTGHHSQTVHEGRWSASPDFCYWDGELVELAGRTLGIVGYGRIGKAVAAVGRAFGMQILAHRRTASDDPQFVSLDRLLSESDVVSLHCPLVPDTKELINAARLAQMKPSAFLINTARGALIHEPDLAAALNAERIAGAGLDVLSVEPPLASNPLLSARNCVMTPHIAWATRNARLRLLEVTAANIRSYLLNRPQNVITP
ncbi:MAG: D-2-hydroxyacid dehydrogenase [Planctomycetia bacterium]|nr:D-2-hydroxyacid dehydrogenase [Planctomycetia bacterium]